MPDPKDLLNRLAALAIGAVLYAVLNWIPIAGALAAGAVTGYLVGGGFSRGFRHGIYAASIGSLIVAYALIRYGMADTSGVSTPLIIFIAWVMIVWNLVGILLTGFGAGAGAFGKDIYTVIPKQLKQMFTNAQERPGVDYLICGKCGQGNVSAASICIGCGKSLK